MPKPTQKSLLEAGLKACGWSVDPNAKTSKYNTYTKEGAYYKFLVGKSGALRKTETTASASRSLTHSKLHKAYIEVGRYAECYTSTNQAISHLNEIHQKL